METILGMLFFALLLTVAVLSALIVSTVPLIRKCVNMDSHLGEFHNFYIGLISSIITIILLIELN
jgi:hypothetical protein